MLNIMKPNIFIIGDTKCGKTTLAKKIAEKLNFKHISASQIIRDGFTGNKESPTFTKEITDYSIEKLKLNPNYIINDLAKKHIGLGGFVIEGCRNPRDFSSLFSYNDDYVISITNYSASDPQPFEKYGLIAIRAIIDFYEKTTLLNSNNIFRIVMAYVDGPSYSCHSDKANEFPIPNTNETFLWNMDDVSNYILNNQTILSLGDKWK